MATFLIRSLDQSKSKYHTSHEVDSRYQKLSNLVRTEDLSGPERQGLIRLMQLFADLPPPPDPLGLYLDYPALKESFVEHLSGHDSEALEESFLTLYCHLHGHEAPYTRQERKLVEQTGGYWCHAGGLSPIIKAPAHIRPDTISGDFGAGNGLQTLLMMKLCPHQKTILIEISSRMAESGRQLQTWLGIDPDRVEWIVGDILDATPKDMDFIYLYRPVRPEGEGRKFYQKFAQELSNSTKPLVIFSIADCLRPFLSDKFKIFYTDGHLTCFRKVRESPGTD